MAYDVSAVDVRTEETLRSEGVEDVSTVDAAIESFLTRSPYSDWDADYVNLNVVNLDTREVENFSLSEWQNK